MAKRNKRRRERASQEMGSQEIKLRFTRAPGGKLRVEGADPENEKLVRKLLGNHKELTIDESAIQLVDEDTGKPVVLADSGLMRANITHDENGSALVLSAGQTIDLKQDASTVDRTRVRLLNAKPDAMRALLEDQAGFAGVNQSGLRRLSDKGKELQDIRELSDDTIWALGFARARSIGFTEQTGAVDTYLRCVRALLEGSDGAIRGLGGANPAEGVRLSRRLWARMSTARVFEFPDHHYVALHKSCDAVITEYHENRTFELRSPDDLDSMATDTLGFLRDPLPFESVFLGYGGGVPLPPELAPVRFADGSCPANLIQYRVLGHLVVDSGTRLAVEMGYVITADDNYLHPLVVYDSEEGGERWKNAMTLAPWIVGSMVRLINEHKVLVEEKRIGLGQRMEADRIRKKYRHKSAFIPKPYYRLVLKDAVIEDAGKRKDALGPPRVLSYRHDRESHDRYYVRRGPLPMDPKKQAKLEKGGYRIWLLDRPGADVLEQLARRGMAPKRADEWMAVLVRRIAEQVIGDPKLPYVPALRVPKVLETPAGKLTGAGGA